MSNNPKLTPQDSKTILYCKKKLMEQEQDGGCTISRFGAWEQEIKSWIGQWFSLSTQKVIPQQGLALKGHWLKEVPHQTRMTGKLPNSKTNKQTKKRKPSYQS